MVLGTIFLGITAIYHDVAVADNSAASIDPQIAKAQEEFAARYKVPELVNPKDTAKPASSPDHAVPPPPSADSATPQTDATSPATPAQPSLPPYEPLQKKSLWEKLKEPPRAPQPIRPTSTTTESGVAAPSTDASNQILQQEQQPGHQNIYK